MSQETDELTPDDEEDIVEVVEQVPAKHQLHSIFDDDMVEKYSCSDGKPRWKCKWCDVSFSGWNATKAIAHVTKQVKMDIKPCKAKIDLIHTSLYHSLLYNLKKKRSRTSNSNEHMAKVMENHNDALAKSLESKRKPPPSTISTKRSKFSYSADTLLFDGKYTYIALAFLIAIM